MSTRELGFEIGQRVPLPPAEVVAAPPKRQRARAPHAVAGVLAAALVGGTEVTGRDLPRWIDAPAMALVVAVLAAQWATKRPAVLRRSEQPGDALARELDRSRRHGHSFTLLRLRGRVDRYDEVVPYLRSVDQAWSVSRDLYVLLPETERAAAAQLLERLRPHVGDAPVDAVAFPESAVTASALLRALDEPEASS